jgi:NitT/TauT family transport system permease protein
MATNTVDPNQPQKLTRQQLKEMETKQLTPLQRFFELVIMILPLICGIISILEYVLIPDKGRNAN